MTLRELEMMACGKMELLGGMTGARESILPYNPAILQGFTF